MEKIIEEITKPDINFRFCRRIGVCTFLELLEEKYKLAEKKGYENMELAISEDFGIVDVMFYGSRDLNKKEIARKEYINNRIK